MAGEILVGNRRELCASRLHLVRRPQLRGVVATLSEVSVASTSKPLRDLIEVLGVSFQAKASCTASSTPGVTSLGFVN